MTFLGVVLGMVGFISLMGVYQDYKTKNKNLKANGKKLEPKEFFTKGYIIATIVGIACIIGFFICSCNVPNKSKTNKWDSLTKEEKQWYEDNYGDGQYDKYKKAIDNYKKNK